MTTRILIAVLLLFAACTATSLQLDTSSRFGRFRSSSRSRSRSFGRSTRSSISRRSIRRGTLRRSTRSPISRRSIRTRPLRRPTRTITSRVTRRRPAPRLTRSPTRRQTFVRRVPVARSVRRRTSFRVPKRSTVSSSVRRRGVTRRLTRSTATRRIGRRRVIRRPIRSTAARRIGRKGTTHRLTRPTSTSRIGRRKVTRRVTQPTEGRRIGRRRVTRRVTRSTDTRRIGRRKVTRRLTRPTGRRRTGRRRVTRRPTRPNSTRRIGHNIPSRRLNRPRVSKRTARRGPNGRKTQSTTASRKAGRSRISRRGKHLRAPHPSKRSKPFPRKTRLGGRRRPTRPRTTGRRTAASKRHTNQKKSTPSSSSRLTKRGRRRRQRAKVPSHSSKSTSNKSKKTPIADGVTHANTVVSLGGIVNNGRKKLTGRHKKLERRVTDSRTRRSLTRLGAANTVYGFSKKAWNALSEETKQKVRNSSVGKRASSAGKTVQPYAEGVATGVTAGTVAYTVAPRRAKNYVDRKMLQADNKLREIQNNLKNRIKNPLPKVTVGERAKSLGKTVLKGGKRVVKKFIPGLGYVSLAQDARDLGKFVFENTLPESTQDKIKDRILPTGAGGLSGAERRIARHGIGRHGPEVRAQAAQAKAQRQQRRDRVIAERQRLRKKANEVRAAFPKPKRLSRRERRRLNSNPGLRNKRRAQQEAHEKAEAYAQELRQDADNLQWNDIQGKTK